MWCSLHTLQRENSQILTTLGWCKTFHPFRPFISNLRLPRRSQYTKLQNRWFATNAQDENNCLNPRRINFSDAQRRTIYALSTPPGKAGVAVVRISGPDALLVWKNMVVPYRQEYRDGQLFPEPWKMVRSHIVRSGKGSELLDDGLAVYFRAPRSFTTEDVVELHIHSGRAIISSVLSALAQLQFCRPAEPGEFTRRAFQGGRLDLTEVEGLHDLINAETEEQRRIALKAAGGVTRAHFEELRHGIIDCLANVEALVDFGEDESIEDSVYEQARERARKLLATIQKHLQDGRRGEIIRSGIRLAIFGPPNAGKSSLFNFLAQREAAIVTPVPGTTRDTLELSLDIGGLPVIITDTAGLHKTEDVVESIGIERAKNAVRAADISLCVLSLPEVVEETPISHEIRIPLSLQPLVTPETYFLFNKSDLLESSLIPEDIAFPTGQAAWTTSMVTGERTNEFLAGFTQALQDRFGLQGVQTHDPTPLITRTRYRTHLKSACHFLEAFLDTSDDIVLGAEELRYAAQAVGKVSGLIGTDDILDVIFKDFCIGK